MKKILAFALVALLAVASIAPAFAADKENVMLTAEFYDAINITPDKGDYVELFDEMIAVGPNHIVGGCNLRITMDGVVNRFDVDGYDDEEGAYLGFVAYELDKVYTVDSFKMYVIDMAPLGVGVDNTIDWLPMGFDLLVSTTGEDGSWKVVYSGKDLHGEGDDAGVWQYGEENDESLAHYYLDFAFTEATDAKFIRWAPTSVNNSGDPTSAPARYFNISELQVFGVVSPNQPAETDPIETEPVETEPVETEAPATEAGATETPETEPAPVKPAVENNSSTILIVAVAVGAVLAVLVIVAIVLKKKKEN